MSLSSGIPRLGPCCWVRRRFRISARKRVFGRVVKSPCESGALLVMDPFRQGLSVNVIARDDNGSKTKAKELQRPFRTETSLLHFPLR